MAVLNELNGSMPITRNKKERSKFIHNSGVGGRKYPHTMIGELFHAFRDLSKVPMKAPRNGGREHDATSDL